MIEQNQTPALRLGDWIEADFTYPSQHTRAAQLNTPESLAFGAELLADPASGWRRATRDWAPVPADNDQFAQRRAAAVAELAAGFK